MAAITTYMPIPIATFLDQTAGPLYRQIYDAYREAILGGRLVAGQRVPSTRALAAQLGISRLPVLNAFEQLLHEGYFEGRVGSGTYVAATMRSAPGRSEPRLSPQRVNELPDRSTGSAFRISLPALDHFPVPTWSRLVSRHARAMTPATMAYGSVAGLPALRSAIADHLRIARAVHCDASQVLIVSGSQMALQLCAHVLLSRGDLCGFEEPGYPGAREALAATGALFKPIPVDEDGLDVTALARLKRPVRSVYVTPSHQYPLGVSMSAPRRLELLDWAAHRDAWIIEDDYDSDYRYASRPLPSLHGMDRASRVIYIGTFSKVLFPALRMGYVVVPPTLVERFVAVRRALDICSPTLYQLALADFIREGHFARHVRRMRTLYCKRRDSLVEAIQLRLPDALTIVRADAGMHLTALLDPRVEDTALVARAAASGVSVAALSSCYAGKKTRSGLVLGFGGADGAEIARGVGVLATAIEAVRMRR